MPFLRAWTATAVLLLLSLGVTTQPLLAQEGSTGARMTPDAPITLRVIGSNGLFSQYEALEAPFWREELPKRTQGRLRGDAAPYNRVGLRGEDLLRLVELGVAAVATLPLALLASDEPEFSTPDLPLMQGSIDDLQRSVDTWRSYLAQHLREEHHVELLAVYTYPAQLLFCREPMQSLSDIAGRRVRSSGAEQSDLLTALGATPVVLAFADIRSAFRSGQLGCAITGGLPGLENGLQQESRYLYTQPISWNLNAMVISTQAIENLSPDLAEALRIGTRGLEAELWRSAADASRLALHCAAGDQGCPAGAPHGSMTLVPERPEDRPTNQSLIRTAILPAWAHRCGEDCRKPWNETFGATAGLQYPAVSD